MLIIDAIVMTSEHVKGLGLFSTGYLADGEMVWKKTLAETMSVVDDKNKKFYDTFGWYDMKMGKHVLPKDDGRYIRCSPSREEANLIYVEGNFVTSSELFNRTELLLWYPSFMDIDSLDKFLDELVPSIRNKSSAMLNMGSAQFRNAGVIGETKTRTAWRNMKKSQKWSD